MNQQTLLHRAKALIKRNSARAGALAILPIAMAAATSAHAVVPVVSPLTTNQPTFGFDSGGGQPNSATFFATTTSTGKPCQTKLAASMIMSDLSGRIHSGNGLEATSQPQTNSRQGSRGRSL